MKYWLTTATFKELAPIQDTYIHTLHTLHTYIHAYMHTCIHAYMHTCIHTYIHTHIHIHIHIYIICIYGTWDDMGGFLNILNIPAGGKLNRRYLCSWRSYDRHWMPNAWFWRTFQLMTFAVPLSFGFFLAFCNVFCIHELAKSASLFCIFL